MLTFSLILYIVVALIGIYLLIKIISGSNAKMVTGIIHGSLGLAGIACLIFYISFVSGEVPVQSILLFVTAFLFGGGMLITKMLKKKYPVWILILHVIIAATGIYLLINFRLSL